MDNLTLDKSTLDCLQIVVPDFLYELAPTFQRPLMDAVVEAGDTVMFTCKVCGRPRPTVTWRGPDQSILSNGPTMVVGYTDDGTTTLQVYTVH